MIKFAKLLAIIVLAMPMVLIADRDFAERQAINLTGDFKMIGNTNIQCVGTTNGNSCSDQAFSNNPPVITGYVNVDNDGININSSRASLIIPVGATIEWAGLYWSGVDELTGRTTQADLIDPPAGLLRNQVRFRTPGSSSYNIINADQVDSNDSFGFWDTYMSFADVTSMVQSAGAGDYYVGNIRASTGSNFTGTNAGWNLVVVYKLEGDTFKRVNIWDGWKFFGFNEFEEFTVTGLLTPNSGIIEAKVGVWALDGEVNQVGDSITLAGNLLSNGLNPTNNFANGTISELGSVVSTGLPSFDYNWGVDIDTYDALGMLGNNVTTANVRLGSSSEGIWSGIYVLSTRLVIPSIEKSFSASTVDFLQVSELSITIDNPFEGISLNGVNISDSLPAGMVVANGSNATNSCGGTFAAPVGSNEIILTGGTIGPGASCTVTVNVITNAEGSFYNIIPKEDLDTAEGIDAKEDAEATLIVNGLVNGVIIGNVSEEVTADLNADNPLSGVTVNLIQRYNVINGRIDVNGDGSVNGLDDGIVGGVIIVNGFVDISGNAVSNGQDDGSLGGVTVINGRLDMDGNGSVNATDRVNDDGTLEVAIGSQVTDANGNYSFNNLTPGNYIVQQVNLANYVDLTDTDVSDDGDGASDPVDNEIPVILSNGETDSDNNFVDRPPLADISVTKSDNQGAYTPGATFEYEIVVTNNGPHSADGTMIADNLPGWALGVVWTCTAQNGAVCPVDGTGNINATIPTLPDNGVVTFTVTGTYATNVAAYP